MTPKSNKSINFEAFLLISSLPFLFLVLFSSFPSSMSSTQIYLYLSLSYCQLLWNVLDSNFKWCSYFLPFNLLFFLFFSRVGHDDATWTILKGWSFVYFLLNSWCLFIILKINLSFHVKSQSKEEKWLEKE